MDTSIKILLSSTSDSIRLGELHCLALPNDFLPSLGLRFIQKVYYPLALQSDHAATFIAMHNDRIVGFVTIAHNTTAFSNEIFKKGLVQIFLYSLRKLIFNPFEIIKFFQVFWKSIISKPIPIQGEIVFIAVEENYKNRGIGKELVRRSLNYLQSKGVKNCRTKTLSTNINVIKLYKDLGWKKYNCFKLIGNEYLTLSVDISS